MSTYSRRTVVRGAAWSVPVIAIAAPIPAFATSHEPPPPVINFGGACGNTGSTGKGCGGKFTLEVPLTLSNPGTTAIIFQITGMFTRNVGPAPLGSGPGVYDGIRGIFATPGHAPANQNQCTLVTPPPSGCTGGLTGGSVLVPAGTTSATYWIESAPTGSADDFASTIYWRLLDAATCDVLSSGNAKTTGAIQPQNCVGS